MVCCDLHNQEVDMELVEKLMKLNILYIREMERRGIIKVKNMGQLTEPLGVHSQNLTVLKATNYLKNKIDKNSNIVYLKDEINKLQEQICNSKIKDYKFWNGNFNEEENKLDDSVIKRLFFMETGFVGTTQAQEYTGITVSAIKQACQREKLLNTKKLGKTWLVHLPEVRAYWNVPDKDEKSLYKDWKY
ncbi:hypothetical protein [Clostridium botulinum]|uniref:Uncharacterized protein n=2 Tax=Clostridium botulinum TaxID=1491 RepID=A0A846JHP2_CLOBO|nr:hypothetical protein [Clostridium botulinum]APH23539.1 hypothetical protein NPD1_3064 [Clostridium botulinum]APQ67614.1 hypothetical protein RSJ8_1190 [Clostridium botulinum]NFH65081.1 hypothetical protein [Clostridium botulinum]NFJ09465.1 hypothetical protein [Clostridium botulinum]NFK16713.1 hypothetical protein [Clostridium botulinum]